MTDFTRERQAMVDRQIAARGIADPHLLAAMRDVPRHLFVGEDQAAFAYEDGPLPIAAGQTISQPYIVALMIEAAGVKPGARVLEIGAGSGYAAAILGRIAERVVAVERHPELVRLASERLAAIGLDNVIIREGDGTAGWASEAPYDGILAAASGSHVPASLKQQLALGGRLVMPVGGPDEVQRLVRVTRREVEEFVEEDLGPVRFVPLIGKEGWGEKGSSPATVVPLEQRLADAALRLPDPSDSDFSAAFDRFAEARIVLLGEASHGTSEFYRARAAITRRLIERYGFTIVAVEADWPDAAAIDRHVRHRPPRTGEGRRAADAPFQRFPTWMWRNAEVEEFVRWLRGYNEDRPFSTMAGFFGLDLYNLGSSIRAVVDYLDEVAPDAAALARERYGCLQPWSRNPATYGRLAITEGYARCEQAVVSMLADLQRRRWETASHDGEEWLDATANARLIKNAEAYYRAMYEGEADSWNLRDTHMFETLCHLLDAQGPDSRAVVWAHNSHIGNAAFTEMGRERGELNIGQLVRERFGEAACLVGFGTHEGSVAAATDWDGPMEIKAVRPSLPGSQERLCHDSGVPRFLIDLREGLDPELQEELQRPRLERFIGVIYRPETERWSHYAEAVLAGQFDAWVWFDRTEAVRARPGPSRAGEDDTWPFGL